MIGLLISGCNIGWTLFNNSCYKFFQDKLTWSAAQTECEAFESLLVTIHSREENNFVWSLIPSGNFDIWMGGSDVASEGSWVWKDGQAWGLFTSWKTGEPNNLGNEDCLLMYDESGNWNDLSCTATRAYVCVKLHGIIAASQ